MIRKLILFLIAAVPALTLSAQAAPETLQIDKGHTFITFKVSHIGFGWIHGGFTDFDGTLVHDTENPANSKVSFTVRIPSLDTWHAERDKHLKSEDFFTADEYPTATFVSTAYEKTGTDTAVLRGDLTIQDITKPVEFQVTQLAAREDPWGNFRLAWQAETELDLSAFKLNEATGGNPKTATVQVALEATRQ